MFGYVQANGEKLSEEQLLRYRGCYCGLCRTLGERYGQLSRFTLNYDMTFLVLVLSAMYEPEEEAGEGTCIAHPVKKRNWWKTAYTDYAADMNVALCYYKCLDDWQDERSLSRRAEAAALKKSFEKVKKLWPRQCMVLENSLRRISEIENSKSSDADAAANVFGEIMGELFAVREDEWTASFRRFGEALGRFVYVIDACADLDEDVKKGRYNPFIAMDHSEIDEEGKFAILRVLIGECAEEFEKLPILQDADIIRNILYSGVWQQYARKTRKKKKGETES